MQHVKRLQADRFELMPNGEQQRKMRQFAGSARYVFNRALAIQNQERESTGRKRSGYAALCRMLTAWRNDPPAAWLAEAPVHTTQQALRNLESAWSRHSESLGKRTLGQIKPQEVVLPPQFKKKHRCRESFRYPDAKQFRIEQNNNRLFLPKLGWLRYRNSRRIQGELASVTVCRDGEKWFVSIQTEREVEKPVHRSSSMVGIDLGVVRFATLSNGEMVQPCHALQQKQARLKRYQRMMARRRKFSQNWRKAKAKVHAVHRNIANIRKDFLHQTTTAISKNHAVVVIEDLKVRNMSKSAAGTKENPGSKVKQKSGLNRTILDQASGVQTAMAGRPGAGRSAARHQPAMPALRSYVAVQPQDPGAVSVSELWSCGQRRRCFLDEYSFPGHRGVLGGRAGHGARLRRVGNHSPDRL